MLSPAAYSRRFHAMPDNLKGAATIMVAALAFAGMTVLIKFAGERLPVTQILLVRQLIMTGIVLPSIVSHFPGCLKTERLGLQFVRVGFALVAMLCGFTAIIHLPLADATALGFAKAFFTTIFAVWLLQEVVGWRRWMGVALGFLGVFIMMRPGLQGFDPMSILAVTGAAGAGMVMVIIRILSRTEMPITILSYQAILVGLAVAVPAYIYWVPPTMNEWLLLGAIGIISYGAQMMNIYAYKWGEASLLASLDYVRLLYATLLGFVFFNTLPTIWTGVGAFVIIGASLYTVHRERKKAANIARGPHGRGYTNT